MTHDEALAALGLAATPAADRVAVQQAFERLARRYPQPNFPERFRQLLEARDHLLDTGRVWREMVQSRTLDLAWVLGHVAADPAPPASDRRTSLQRMLRTGYLAEVLSAPIDPDVDDSDDDDEGELDEEDSPF
jgi:hypothetical protein